MRKEGAQMSEKIKVACYIRVKEDYDRLNIFAEKYNDSLTLDRNIEYMGFFVDPQYRDNWVRLVKKAEDGELDKIIVSEIMDIGDDPDEQTYQLLKLKDTGCEVYFEREDKSSHDPGFMEALDKASVIYNTIKLRKSMMYDFGLTRMTKDGDMIIAAPLGYDMDIHGDVTINNEEKETVQKIYKLYLRGWGYTKIANHLEEKGYKTKLKSGSWYATTIKNVLKNKRYTEGVADQRFNPIIDLATFDMVQKKIKEQESKYKRKVRKAGCEFKGKIKCGNCGSTYYFKKRGNRGYMICNGKSRYSSSYCKSKTIRIEVLKDVYLEAFNEYEEKRVSKSNVMPLDETVEKLKTALEGVKEAFRKDQIDLETYEIESKRLAREIDEKEILLTQIGFKVPGITIDSKSTKYDKSMVDFLISAEVKRNQIKFIFDGGIEITKPIKS